MMPPKGGKEGQKVENTCPLILGLVLTSFSKDLDKVGVGMKQASGQLLTKLWKLVWTE